MQHNLKSVSKFIELKKYDPLLKNELLILIKDCNDPDQIILKNNPNKAYNKLYQFQAHSPPFPRHLTFSYSEGDRAASTDKIPMVGPMGKVHMSLHRIASI